METFNHDERPTFTRFLNTNPIPRSMRLPGGEHQCPPPPHDSAPDATNKSEAAAPPATHNHATPPTNTAAPAPNAATATTGAP